MNLPEEKINKIEIRRMINFILNTFFPNPARKKTKINRENL